MKRLGLIIAAAAALALGGSPLAAFAADAKAPPIAAKQREQGKAEAPAAIAAAKITCTPTDAYLVGQSTDPKTKAKTSTYEVSCQEGPGYVVQQTAPDMAQSFDCLALESAPKDPKGGGYTCRLEGNLDAKAGYGKLLASTGHPCTATGARYIGSGGGTSYYEVACSGDQGYVIEVATGKPATASDCFSNLGGQLECKLTTKEQIYAGLGKTMAPSGKPCTVSNARAVGVDRASGSSYFEVSCGQGAGYIVQADAKGAFQNIYECAKAQNIAGGCTLTVIDETKEADTYTKLAKTAGFTCDVSKYRFLGKETKSNSEIVELACKNRPDGGIGLFPISGGAAKVFDCVQGGFLGLGCQLGQSPAPVYTRYTQGIASKKGGATTCTVASAKYLASLQDGSDLVETACGNGEPGYVLALDHNSGAVKDLMTCGQLKSSGAACALPSNVATAKK